VRRAQTTAGRVLQHLAAAVGCGACVPASGLCWGQQKQRRTRRGRRLTPHCPVTPRKPGAPPRPPDRFYEAKVLKSQKRDDGQWYYLIHYIGWNKKWDEWVEASGLQSANDAAALGLLQAPAKKAQGSAGGATAAAAAAAAWQRGKASHDGGAAAAGASYVGGRLLLLPLPARPGRGCLCSPGRRWQIHRVPRRPRSADPPLKLQPLSHQPATLAPPSPEPHRTLA
jgi:hypothetical protein